mmetsp:Transcript_83187/g.152131  ORF Transcript_83187/g.152131 Transcript_83187/m.152131 type:complete len:134 (+) Transcript_83187:73-474(+)
MAMRNVILVLACLACVGQARTTGSRDEGTDLKSLASLLLASNPSAGFASSGPAARLAGRQVGTASKITPTLQRSDDVAMLEVKVPDKRPKELYPWPNMETKEGVREFAYGFWIGGVGGAVVAFVLLINIDFFN